MKICSPLTQTPLQELSCAPNFGPVGDTIGGFRGAMAPKMPKVALFALHMQCIINLYSKTAVIKFILNMCICRGFSCPIKAFASEAAPGDQLLPKKSTSALSFRFQFLTLGASSPFVTPISGYPHVSASNNKQYK